MIKTIIEILAFTVVGSLAIILYDIKYGYYSKDKERYEK